MKCQLGDYLRRARLGRSVIAIGKNGLVEAFIDTKISGTSGCPGVPCDQCRPDLRKQCKPNYKEVTL